MIIIRLLKFILIFIYALTLTSFSNSTVNPKEDFIPNSVTHVCLPDKVLYRFDVTWEKIKSTPLWVASGTAAPLLKPEKAYDIAQGEIVNYADDTGSYLLSSISLQRFGDSHHWFYIFSFEDVKTNIQQSSLKPLIDPSIDIVILLSGKSIKGQKTSYDMTIFESYKNIKNNECDNNSNAQIDFISSEEKIEYIFHVEFQDLISTPSWIPSKNKPMPLYPEEAIRIARNEIKDYLANYWEYDVYNVELKRFQSSEKWLYLVGFRKSSSSDGSLNMVVLSSGKSIKGEKRELNSLEE